MNRQLAKNITDKLESLAKKSGVYLFKDKKGEILYVGKAKILRNRVRSYFQEKRPYDPKLYRLISRTTDIETIVTDSEVEALILEANLIKENKPRYNINLKDDKSFPYIRVTNEPFPRIFPTRKIIRDGSKYFGPYTDVKSMKSLLKTVKKIFTIRSCNYNLNEETIAQRKFKLCLDYHIHRCQGPCEGLISQVNYHIMLNHVIDFIEGRTNKVSREIRAHMQECVKNLNFEEAARLRDQLEQVEMFSQKQKVVDASMIDRDIVAAAHDHNDSCCVVFKMREGKILGRQHFYLSGTQDETITAVLNAFIKQYYLKSDYIPAEIFSSVNLGTEKVTLEKWLSQKRGEKATIKTPAEGEHAKLLRMCGKNAALLLEELKLQRMKSEEFVTKSVLALQEELKLPQLPRRIEGFDISNIQGKEPVASMVSFLNGMANKSEYRKFKIRSKTTPDDFLMMKEVVGRRYARILKEKKILPDLVLIDGGKGQLNAALEALKELSIVDLPIISLAKRLDEVFVPGISEPQNIHKGSPALHLLQRVRDESHRFAVTFHRTLRKKTTLASELDSIPGIGPARRKLLLKHFGSVQNIMNASYEDLLKVKTIAPKIAEKIAGHFHKLKEQSS